MPATSTVSPPLSRCSGACGRPGTPTGRELRVALEPLALALRHPDLGAGSLGEVGDAAEVVEVPVRDQDPGARGAEPRELEPQVGRVPAGIDHRALGRAALAAGRRSSSSAADRARICPPRAASRRV